MCEWKKMNKHFSLVLLQINKSTFIMDFTGVWKKKYPNIWKQTFYRIPGSYNKLLESLEDTDYNFAFFFFKM